MDFKYFMPVNLKFGVGCRKQVGFFSKKIGKKCLIVRSSVKDTQREAKFKDVVKSLEKNKIEYFIFDEVESNPTIKSIEEGANLAITKDVDFILGYGGGSAMDSAKAIALYSQKSLNSWEKYFNSLSNPFEDDVDNISALPVVTVTTTSGTGSHITQASVLSNEKTHEKLTLFHSALFPKISFVDPELMVTMPQESTAETGFDAFSHAFESYLSPKATVLTKMMSLKAIEIIVNTLPSLLNDLTNLKYREEMAFADTLAGICLSNAGAEAPHPIAEMINGYYPELSHGKTLSMVYPYFITFISEHYPEKMKEIEAIFEKAQKDSNKEAHFNEFLKQINLTSENHQVKIDAEVIEAINHNFVFDLPISKADDLKALFQKVVEEYS